MVGSVGGMVEGSDPQNGSTEVQVAYEVTASVDGTVEERKLQVADVEILRRYIQDGIMTKKHAEDVMREKEG